MHKALIDVNEQGTEAAAATGIAVGITAAHSIRYTSAQIGRSCFSCGMCRPIRCCSSAG